MTRKLSDDQVREIRQLLAEGRYSEAVIARHFNVASTTIGQIARGRTHRSVPGYEPIPRQTKSSTG